MIGPGEIERALQTTERKVHTHGDVTWGRIGDWVKPQRPPSDDSRGGGVRDGKSDDRLHEEHLDRQASRYNSELDKLTDRLAADLNRLQELIRIANPEVPRSEIGAGCRSCQRDGGRYEPIAPGRYKHACRFCGDWRGEHGDWPPLAVVRWRSKNPGKKVPLKVVEQASA